MFLRSNSLRSRGAFILFTWLSCAASAAAQGNAPIEFVVGRTIPTPGGSTPPAIAADILGSSDEDIVEHSNTIVRVVDTHAVGGAQVFLYNSGLTVKTLAAADLDADGHNDLVCGNLSSGFSVIKNFTGSATVSSIVANSSSTPLRLGDVTGDGFPDVVYGTEIGVNDGQGNFPSAILIPWTSTDPLRDMLPGDFDGDGDLDLVAMTSSTGSTGSSVAAQIIRNDGSGLLTMLAPTIVEAGATFASAHVADMNQDQIDDLLLVVTTPPEFSGAPGGQRLRTHLGQTNSAFVGTVDLSMQGTPFSPAFVADFNGDGFPDVILATLIPTRVSNSTGSTATAFTFGTMSNDGSGALCPAFGCAFPGLNQGTASPVVADDDGDGALDFICRGSSGNIVVYRNTSASAVSPQTVVPSPIGTSILPRFVGSSILFESTFSTIGPSGPTASSGRIVEASFPDPAGATRVQRIALPQTGWALFTMPPNYAQNSVPVTFSVAEGTIGTYVVHLDASIIVTGGDGQFVSTLAPFPIPITGRVIDSSGAPIAGIPVEVSPSGALQVAIFTSTSAVSDSNGDFSFSATANYFPGVGSFNFFYRYTETSPTLTLSTATYVMTILQGDGQSTCTGVPFPTSIIGRLTIPEGTPVVGATINVETSFGPAVASFASTSSTTDVNGNFVFSAIGGPDAGQRAYSVRIANGSQLGTVTLANFAISTLNVIHSPPTSIDIGEAPPTMFVRLLDPLGAPMVGVPVALVPLTLGIAVPQPIIATDATGTATFQPIVASPGTHRVRASFCAGSIDLDLTVRGLAVANLGFILFAGYTHDHPLVPLILAVDVASTAPTWTPYGDVWTSILAPMPTLAILDGVGFSGTASPNMSTDLAGRWSRNFPAVPPLGISVVAQIYGYGPIGELPSDWFVSNAFHFSL